MGYAPGLAFFGTVKLRVLWGLAQVLSYVSTIKINVRRSTRVRKNQFVIAVNEINRFYMRMQRCVITTWYDFSFLHGKVVVQHNVYSVMILKFHFMGSHLWSRTSNWLTSLIGVWGVLHFLESKHKQLFPIS